ncbi:PqqD family peptide modification chaperone [Eubacterium ramulus]|nr:PqqD family peptide modification chaperone [Eubacterium ramulus]MSC94592.1 PqqD family peptide modification chaperone [Eubacterium ramulus]MSD16181.1 PqqD family peptide modification chaperone [Eubacterium ramulus]
MEMEIFMLKQQQGYVLSKIGPHTYLLPYGQSIADQKHGIIINETGEFLWKMLETPQSMDTLITALAGHYHMDITALQLLSSTVPVYFLFSGYIPKTDILP